MLPQNLNWLLRIVVAKWTFAVWFHANASDDLSSRAENSEEEGTCGEAQIVLSILKQLNIALLNTTNFSG